MPISLKNLTKIKKILVENNKIEIIPENIFDKMYSISKIDFSNNKIENIPSSIQDKQKLTYIDLTNNKIKKVPNFLFELPSIK